jgi:hypothetical protein
LKKSTTRFVIFRCCQSRLVSTTPRRHTDHAAIKYKSHATDHPSGSG